MTSKDPDIENQNPRRAVSYVRVSSREQVEGYSLAAQQEACRRRVEDEGWELAAEFCDSGESARTADRPQFQAMLQALSEDPSITVLVVHKLDRLARNLEDHVAIKARLRKLGVQLVSVSESFEESASGKLVEGIMASIAEFYSANLAQEVKKGMNQKARSGGWSGLAPVGYKNVRLPRDGSRFGEAVIVPDAEQAPLVRLAFERFATGDVSLNELHDEMTRRGLRARTGKALSRSRLAQLLHNRAYIGKVVWGGEEFEGNHEPLVSEEVFERVQDVFRIHDRAGERRRRHGHYLKGTLYCGSCGERLSTQHVKKGTYPYFYCLGDFTGRTNCGEPYTRAEILESEIEDLYRRVALPPEVVARLRADLEAEVKKQQATRVRSQNLLRRRLARLDTEKAKVLDAYYSEAITAEHLKGEQQRIADERVQVHEQLVDAERNLIDAQRLVRKALTLAGNLHRAYTAAPPQVRRQYNQALLGKVFVRNGTLTSATTERPTRQSRRNPVAHGPSR